MNLNEALTLAKSLMDQHGLTGWRFEFDRATRRFGVTKYGRRTIGLSKALTELNGAAEVKNTILHEIAHAKVGPGYGHGGIWRDMARSIGCDAKRCYGLAVIKPAHKYIGTCPKCGFQTARNRRTNSACSKCCNQYNGGRFTFDFLFTWARNQQEAAS